MSRRSLPLWNESAKSSALEIGRAIARKMLSRERSAAACGELVAQAVNEAQAMTSEALKDYPPRAPIACKEGCSWCCHVKVNVRAPEIIRIVDHLRRTLSAEELAKVHQRVIAADEKTRGMTHDERGARQLDCPLLVDRRCSVYPVRPVSCRGWVSLQAEACKRNYDNTVPGKYERPETYVPQHEIYNAAIAGVGLGAAQEGLDGSVLELNAALRIALDRPSAPERWAQGRQVFAVAHDAEYRALASPEVVRGLTGDRGIRR